MENFVSNKSQMCCFQNVILMNDCNPLKSSSWLEWNLFKTRSSSKEFQESQELLVQVKGLKNWGSSKNIPCSPTVSRYLQKSSYLLVGFYHLRHLQWDRKENIGTHCIFMTILILILHTVTHNVRGVGGNRGKDLAVVTLILV